MEEEEEPPKPKAVISEEGMRAPDWIIWFLFRIGRIHVFVFPNLVDFLIR